MVDEKLSPTGPKIHPERAQREAISNFLNRHTDIAEALLTPMRPKTLDLVRLEDIEKADIAAAEQGIPYTDIVRQEQNNILSRFMPQFAALQNKYQVNEPFLEQYLRKKDDFNEQVRKMRRRYPDPDFQGELADMMRPTSINLRLTRNYMFSQARLVELGQELYSRMRQGS